MGQVKIIPYVTVDGVPTFKDSEIKGVYDRMVEEGTADMTFYGGSIRSSEEFLNAMKGPNNFLIMIYWNDELSAVMWANRFQYKWAQNHFCCFKNIWGNHKVIHRLGRESCLWLLDNLQLDCLFSMIPESNRPAIAAVLGGGATVVGTSPLGAYNHKTGESEGAVWISYIREGNQNEDLQ